MLRRTKRNSRAVCLDNALIAGLQGGTTASAEGHRHGPKTPDAFREPIAQSIDWKVGITFFLNGQASPAVVTKLHDDGTVEAYSQHYRRIVIRLHRVNAIARQTRVRRFESAISRA